MWVLAVFGSLLCTRAQAHRCFDEACTKWCSDTVRVAVDAMPSGVDEATAAAEIQRALDAWNAVDCSSLQLTYVGLAATAESDVVIRWAPNAEGRAFGGSPYFYTQSMRAEGDAFCTSGAQVFLNSAEFMWVTEGANGYESLSVYSMVLQQMAFVAGLGISDVASSVTTQFTATELDADDISGVCTVYPSSGVPPAVPPTPDPAAPVCTACATAEECGVGSTCTAYGIGQNYCATDCATAADCQAGFVCMPNQGRMSCIRQIAGLPNCVDPFPVAPTPPPATPMPPPAATDAGVAMTPVPPATAPPATGGSSTASGGCSAAGPGSAASSWLVMLALFRRRRREAATPSRHHPRH